ncbi:MAG: TolC family protein [Planctomycetota bacterium]
MHARATKGAPGQGRRLQSPARVLQLRRRPLRRANACLLASAFLALSGCVLSPQGAESERARLADVGKAYEPRFEERVLADLPDAPVWQDILHRAFMANGDVEGAYFRWKAAVERIDVAGAWPNSDVSLGYEYMFSRERMKAFDRSTFTAGFDSAMSLSLPIKVEQGAKVALDEARVAGEEFRVAKFDLQRAVLQTWAEYVLQEQLIALRTEDLAIRRVQAEAAAGGVRSGRRVRDVLAADLDLRTDENGLLDLRSEHDQTRAKLNALMGRPPQLPLRAPLAFPPPRELPDDDAVLFSAAADRFPEVAVLGREVEGRADALELARLRWIPDISPTLGFTGSLSQTVGLMLTLPTNIAGIRGQIREAQAQLRASQAMLRQRSSDRIGEYFSLLLMYRNAQRQAAVLETAILPAAKRLSDEQVRAYEGGASTFAEVIESRRLPLSIRELIATAHAQMDKALVEIECCLGLDIEQLPSAAPPLPPGEVPPAPPVNADKQEARHEH